MVVAGLILAGLQTLVVLNIPDPRPVRIGVPLPAGAVAKGLKASRGMLQWRVLEPQPDPVTDRVWVELALCGVEGRVSIRRGASGRGSAGHGPSGPCPGRDGPVYRWSVARDALEKGEQTTRTWTWADGTVDRDVSILLERGDGVWRAGEIQRARSVGLEGRWSRVRIPAEFWRKAGVLPPGRANDTALRDAVVTLARRLAAGSTPGGTRGGDGQGERQGRGQADGGRADGGSGLGDGAGYADRDRGDFRRSGGTFANGEFDLARAFAWVGLGAEDGGLLRAAGHAAQHLVDVDMDRRSGLAFPHGKDHRSGRADPGHTWLQGLLLVGCLSADDERLRWAEGIAQGLARVPPSGEGHRDRARDLAWPLGEMEAWLRFRHSDSIARAADARAQGILGRFHRPSGMLRFGESQLRGGYFRERAWLTSGMVLPALDAHRRRVGSPRIDQCIRDLAEHVAAPLKGGRKGLPISWTVGAEGPFGLRWRQEGGELGMLLAGLDVRTSRAITRRATVRKALLATLDPEHPDAATRLAMCCRCGGLLP